MNNSEGNTPSFEAQLHFLEQHYVLCDTTQIQHILRHDPLLVSLLLDVYTKIATQFPGAKVFLHAVANPAPSHTKDETTKNQTDHHQEIAAFISTNLDPKEAVKRLTEFYQTTWGQAIQATHGKIAVGLECL